MNNSINVSLINLLPHNAKYIGDFYKENNYYFFTIEVPKETSIEFKTNEFAVVSVENKISVLVKVKIGADYLEYLNSFYEKAKSDAQQILFKIPVETLSLSPAVLKILKEISILTIEDLINHSRNSLSKIKYLKGKNLDDIENVLSKMNLQLSQK